MTPQEYYELHAVCPKCKSDDYAHQTMGGLILGDDYEDSNKMWCSCGYIGVLHDCVPKEHKGE
jgi:hypothetical protein